MPPAALTLLAHHCATLMSLPYSAASVGLLNAPTMISLDDPAAWEPAVELEDVLDEHAVSASPAMISTLTRGRTLRRLHRHRTIFVLLQRDAGEVPALVPSVAAAQAVSAGCQRQE